MTGPSSLTAVCARLRRARARRAAARSGRAVFRLRLTAALATILVSSALPACGGSPPGDEFVGFWRCADVALADFTLLEVWGDGDDYRVRIDYLAPHVAPLADGRLLIQHGPSAATPEVEDASTSHQQPRLELALQGAKVTLQRMDPPGFPEEVALERIDEAAYRAELSAMSDDRVRIDIMDLAAAVRWWAEGHGGRTPAVPDLTADTEFGRSLAKLGADWPTNPFTADPMHPGTAPGDFAYETDGRSFELVGYLSTGEAYSAE